MVFSFLKPYALGVGGGPEPTEFRPQNKEAAIADYLAGIDGNLYAYQSAFVLFSKLESQSLKNLHHDAIRDTFDGLVRRVGGRMFYLNNDDIFLIFNKKGFDEFRVCLVKLRFLLGDDPFVKGAFDLEGSEMVAVHKDIASEMGEIRALIAERRAMAEAPKKEDKGEELPGGRQQTPASSAAGGAGAEPAARKVRKELSPKLLAKAEEVLSKTDFSSMIRRQSVCAVIGKSPPQPLFDEVFVSIADLRDMLFSDVDMTSNPWLFAHLTQTLDRRVLSNISLHDDGSFLSNYSLNLNVDTILSDEFLAFDENIGAAHRSSIVLELQLVDILSDVRAFNLARTFAQYRGYKICLDGISPDKLRYMSREFMGADLVKIIWHPSLMDVIRADGHFTDYEHKADRAKMIICRVDDPQAVEVGNAVGINLYQGRYIQRMLTSQPKRVIYKV